MYEHVYLTMTGCLSLTKVANTKNMGLCLSSKEMGFFVTTVLSNWDLGFKKNPSPYYCLFMNTPLPDVLQLREVLDAEVSFPPPEAEACHC